MLRSVGGSTAVWQSRFAAILLAATALTAVSLSSPAMAQFNGSPGTGTGGGGGGGGDAGPGGTGGDGTAGTGGSGGGFAPGAPGNGGSGGAGQSVTSSATNIGTISGGNGGTGGFAALSGGGGGGGGGIDITGSTLTFTNTGTIQGGNGGSPLLHGVFVGLGGAGGGTGGGAASGAAGGGGGGINVDPLSSNVTIVNGGSVTGGNGGRDSTFGIGGGGAGIAGAGLTIINSASITGGMSGDGVTRANAITFTGGVNTLQLQVGSNITGNVVVQSGATGTLQLGGTTGSTFDVSTIGASAQYQGFTGFEKTGTGTWTLTGTTGASTPWTVSGGTLVITVNFFSLGATSTAVTLNGGTLSASGGGIRNDIVLGSAGGGLTDTIMTGNITGIGGLTITGGAGSPTLLGGTNTYTGGTTIMAGAALFAQTALPTSGALTVNGGTAQFGTSQVVGDLSGTGGQIQVAGALTAGGANDTTLAAAITVAGSLVKQGTGTLTLAATNTYTGPTEVAAGRLVVTGSIASNVTVDAAGSFGGTGTVTGNVTNNGFVRPDIGTLNITGTYTNNAGGTYQVEVTPAGQSDLINITGNAVLNGGTVAVLADSGSYARSTRYTILTASTGVTGTFSSVTSNFAFLTPSLSYDADDVFLTLLQNSNAFASGARSGNQFAVGTVLDRVNANAGGDFANVLSALSNLDTTQGPKALDAISGQPAANFGTTNTQTASAFMSAVGAQMAALHGGLGGGTHVALAAAPDQACDFACDAPPPSRYGAWISGVGGLGSALGNSNAGTLTYNFGGTAVGIDYAVAPDLRVGIGAGYITGTQWTSGFDGRGTTDAFSGSLYASWTPSAFYIDGLAGYAYAINRMTRTIAITGLQPRTAQGTTGANQFLGQIEAGYRLALPVPASAAITPFVRLQGSTTTQNGFTESGADSLDLTVAQQTTNSLRTTIGADLSAEIRTVDVDFRLGWEHENADTARPMTASFAGAPGQAFTVFGATPQRDSAVLGLAATTHVADTTELYARYDGEVGGGTDNHAFTAGLRMTW